MIIDFFLCVLCRTLGSGIRWSNLHPQRLLESMKSFNFNFPFDTLDDFMKRVRCVTHQKRVSFLGVERKNGSHCTLKEEEEENLSLFALHIILISFSCSFYFVHFVQAGISSAYQEKPCLDPSDPECPYSAPNKNHTQVQT